MSRYRGTRPSGLDTLWMVLVCAAVPTIIVLFATGVFK